jgi:hypothetical protein
VRKTLAALAVALAVTPVVAGCGSKGSASSTLTAAQWRREVNAVCRKIGPKIRAVRVPVAEARILPFTAEVIPLWKQEEDRIRALVPPSRLATRAEELADALSEVNVALLEIHISTQRRDGLRRYFALQRSATAARGVKLRSRALGLPACARQRVP